MYRSRLIYLAILIIAFLFSQALYDPVSFMTLIIVLILPVLSVVLALLSFPLIRVKTQISKTELCRFDEFIARITVKNYSPFISPSLRIFCSFPDDEGKKSETVIFVANVSVGSGGSFDYSRFFANRGIYNVSVDSVEFYDFLKLIKLKKRYRRKQVIKSLPRMIELRLPVSAEQQTQENSTMVGTSIVQNGGDMVGVREYVMGDNLKNVHWKLSAKGDDLVMKTFAEDIYDQAFVIADMSAYFDDDIKSRSMTDCVVEAALSAIHDYARLGIQFGLVINVSKNEVLHYSIASPTDLFEAETALKTVSMVKDTSVIDILHNVDFNLISGSDVCIITSFASDDTIKNMKKMFIDQKSRLSVVRITEVDEPEKDGIVSYSRQYIENWGRA